MSFFRNKLPKKRVYVDSKPIDVESETTSSQILQQAGKKGSGYSLMTQNPRGGNQLVPAGQKINVHDGQVFESNLPGDGG